MRVIGVDLAWAEHNRTGLCAVDGDRVVESATAGDDDEIVGWISRHSRDGVVVAFDAPLIVKNPRGCRGPERVVASVWGGAHASCHVANLMKPWFKNGGRARRLARRLRLNTDPSEMTVRPPGAAIEVYPHTALVSLFRLPVILKYKAGRSRMNGVSRARTVEERRLEFHRLLDYLLSLRDGTPSLQVAACPEWNGLADRVDRAKSGGDLDRVEDEIDAYVCAYIGLHHLAHRGTGSSVVIGDVKTGYIVTPVDVTRYDKLRVAAHDRHVRIA